MGGNSPESRDALPKGYTFHWYEIISVLGRGAFGVTYLAKDKNLDQEVAVKEYFPIDFATREAGYTIHPTLSEHGDLYQWGLDRFIKEARTLAKFKHHNIVRVLSIFEHNNTAYMIMEYVQGSDLARIYKDGQRLSQPRLLDVFLPIMDGLKLIHDAGFIHRDIKPSNIYIREDGSPVLIDFGSARQTSNALTQSVTSLVTRGYAPFEQFNEGIDKQGPWTDIYSLGACLYLAVTGKLPQDALARGSSLLTRGVDPYERLSSMVLTSDYSPKFLRAIDHALLFHAADRPQDVTTWANMLSGKSDTPPLPVIQASRPTEIGDEEATILLRKAKMSKTADRGNIMPNSLSNTVSRPSIKDGKDRQRDKPAANSAIISMPKIAALLVAVMALGGVLYISLNESKHEVIATHSPGTAFKDYADAEPPAAGTVKPPDAGKQVAKTEPQVPMKSVVTEVHKVSLSAVMPILDRVSCAALDATVNNDTVNVYGYASQRFDMKRLESELLALPGAKKVAADVTPVSNEKCAVMDIFEPYWRVNKNAGGATTIRTQSKHSELTEGDPLIVKITTPPYESYVNLDYYTLDSGVVHMVPGPRIKGNQAPPSYAATIGDLGEWIIAKPFGTELVVLLTTPKPLFDQPREEAEKGADYLVALRERLEQLGRDSARDKITADFVMINTKPQTLHKRRHFSRNPTGRPSRPRERKIGDD